MPSPTNWKDFIINHSDNECLKSKMKSISKLISPGSTGLDGFKLLSSSPSTILLTYDCISNTIIPSFCHSGLGNEILEDQGNCIYLMGLTGFTKTAHPLIFDKSVFSKFQSTTFTPPTWDDILQLGAMAESTKKSRVSFDFQKYATIPPFLTPAVMISDPTPARVLAHMVEIISSMISESKSQKTDKDDSDDDTVVLDSFESQASTSLYQTLLFLWATSTKSCKNKFSPVSYSAFNHQGAMEKTRALTASYLQPEPNQGPTLSCSFSIDDVEATIVAATKAAVKASTDSNSRMVLADEDKPRSIEKWFKNLSERTRKFLLIVSSDGISIPDSPSKECMEILNAKTGPQVVQIFAHWYPNEDFQILCGMAHNLGHGNLMSSHPASVDNVSIFFTPPYSSNFSAIVTQDELFSLSILNDLNSMSKEDTAKMLENKPFITQDLLSLFQTIKNYACVWEKVTSADSLLHLKITEIVDHINSNKTLYQELMKNVENFAVSFLEDIHFRVQKFFFCLYPSY